MPALTTGITFGSVNLDSGGNWITDMRSRRVPGSLKSRFNESWTITEIPGRTQEWEIEISGNLSGGNRDSDEDTLEDYGNGIIRQFVDGKHTGNYIIISIEFTHRNDGATIYPYQLILRQYTQTLPS